MSHKNSFGAKYYLAWPTYKGPAPAGMAQKIGEYYISDWPGTPWEKRACPPWLEILAKSFPEYSLYWAPDVPEPRRMSQAAKASIRKKRLKTRMMKKYPLFAESFAAAEVAADPEYFSGETHLRRKARR